MLIEVEELSHTYSLGTPFAKDALKGINLVIPQGSFTGIIGQTGSGKTTLVQHLNGLLTPTSGTLRFAGKNLWDKGKFLKEVRTRVGLMFQYPEEQLFEETVWAEVAFGLKRLKLPVKEMERRIKEALHKVGLDLLAFKDRSPFELSGGEKRRVAIAGILVMNPEVIILDEPAAGLDPQGRREIFREIKNLHLKEGLTIILVSHNMEDIAKLSDTLVVLQDGEILLQGTPAQVFASENLLKKVGLALPEVNQVMRKLKELGKDVRTDIYTVEEAAKEIIRVMGGAVTDYEHC